MNHTFLCDCCHEHRDASQKTSFDGQYLCEACLEEHTLICEECGQRIWAEDNDGSTDFPLCSSCYNNHYTHCHHCGRLLREDRACYCDDDEDEDYPYCGACYSRISRGSIHNYYYKPEPVFCGEGPRYFGIELEIDGAGELDANARQLLEIANTGRDLIYIKHDGSLEDGMEVITHPMSKEFHKEEMPWLPLMQKAIDMGYVSHQTRTCGLHIHVSRAALGSTESEQDATIARILWFFETNWEELLKFSRRSRSQLERWAARYGLKECPQDILTHAKDARAGRYACVNLQNPDTVEFRIFRGTLKHNTLIAALELVDRIIDSALYLSDDEIQQLSWTTFVAGCQEPELVQYLKERRLYINEPVTCAEEV